MSCTRAAHVARRDLGELRARGKRMVEDFVAVVEELGTAEPFPISRTHVHAWPE